MILPAACVAAAIATQAFNVHALSQIADFAWLAIVLDRPRVERRAPSYGPCISEDRKWLPAILGSAKKPGRLAAHDGLGDRVWLVVDDVHELARRSRTSESKKLQARIVAYRFVCCNLRSTHYSSGHTPWSGRNTFGQGVTHVRIRRGPACQIIPSLIAPHYAAPSACGLAAITRPPGHGTGRWTPRNHRPPVTPAPQALQPPRRQTLDVQFRRQTRRAPQPAPAHPRPRRHRDCRPHWRTVPINPPTKTRPSQP
jgi:hypothetical protein